jgi:hypothetical protein
LSSGNLKKAEPKSQPFDLFRIRSTQVAQEPREREKAERPCAESSKHVRPIFLGRYSPICKQNIYTSENIYLDKTNFS